MVGAAEGVAWGNGPDSTTAYAGPTVSLECGTCHNPHGNGQYRILNPIPQPNAVAPDVFVPVAAGVVVTDAALPAPGDTRNYTIIQNNPSTGTLLASQVAALNLSGNGGRLLPAQGPVERHDRHRQRRAERSSPDLHHSALHLVPHVPFALPQRRVGRPDDGRHLHVPPYRPSHTSRNCVTCHVSHGSNAQMPGTYSANMEYPGGTTGVAPAGKVGDSRLLKVDNRGTCQLCHDPTGTITAGTAGRPHAGPAPSVASNQRVVAGDASPGHPHPLHRGRSHAEELSSRRLTSAPHGSRRVYLAQSVGSIVLHE